MQEHNKEQNPAGNINFEPGQDHGHATQLSHEIEDNKECGQEPSASPGDVHVLPLLAPLHPHAQTILEEGGHKAEAGQVGQHVFAVAQELRRQVGVG